MHNVRNTLHQCLVICLKLRESIHETCVHILQLSLDSRFFLFLIVVGQACGACLSLWSRLVRACGACLSLWSCGACLCVLVLVSLCLRACAFVRCFGLKQGRVIDNWFVRISELAHPPMWDARPAVGQIETRVCQQKVDMASCLGLPGSEPLGLAVTCSPRMRALLDDHLLDITSERASPRASASCKTTKS